MRKILFGIILIILCPALEGQHFSFRLGEGYGWYDLGGVKGFQDDMYNLVSVVIPIEKVVQFPAYYTSGLYVDYHITPKHRIGLNGSLYTSAGRNHIRDYSGEYKFDMIIDGFRLGLHYRYLTNTDRRLCFYGQLNGGLTFSTFNIYELIIVYGVESSATSINYKATPLFGEPSAGIIYRIGDRLSADMNFGYQFDSASSLRAATGSKENLTLSSGEVVKAGWSGLRISLGFSFNLFSGGFSPRNRAEKSPAWDGYFER